MKFQFSIARLLMVTAMVALTFGLARMMLDKKISTYVVFVAVLAADLGLLVLVAQKRSDFYRILHVLVLTFGSIVLCFFAIASLTLIINPDPLNPFSRVFLRLLFIFLIGTSLMLLSLFFSRKIKGIEKSDKKDEH